VTHRSPRSTERLAATRWSRGLAVGALLLAACQTHRWPPPMEGFEVPVEGLDELANAGGPQEVSVLRHSDPVQIRRAGANSAFPLQFYSKRERVRSGGMVLTGLGGRAEVLWPVVGTSVVLFDEGACSIGEPNRGEPTATFLVLTRAVLHINPGDRIELLGGAILRCQSDGVTGPFVLERLHPEILRIRNQTKSPATVAYREEVLSLSPGQLVDLPLLGDTSTPFPVDPDLVALSGGGIELMAKGALQRADRPGALRVTGQGPVRVQGQGVTLDLRSGDAAFFTRLLPPESVELGENAAETPPPPPMTPER